MEKKYKDLIKTSTKVLEATKPLQEYEEPHMDPDEFVGVGNKGQDYHKYQRNPEDLRWKRAEIEVPEPKKKVKRTVKRIVKDHVEVDEKFEGKERRRINRFRAPGTERRKKEPMFTKSTEPQTPEEKQASLDYYTRAGKPFGRGVASRGFNLGDKNPPIKTEYRTDSVEYDGESLDEIESKPKHKPHGIKSDPAYKKAKTKKQILKAREQWNLRNPMDLWVGDGDPHESVEVDEDYVLKGKKARQAIGHWLKRTGIDKARTRPKLTAREADKMFGMSTDEKEKYYADKKKDETGIRDPRLQNKKTPPRQFFFPKSTKMTAKKDVDDTSEAVGDVFAPSGNEPAGTQWKITDHHKSPNIMKKKLMKTKRGRALWNKYANEPKLGDPSNKGDTKSTVMSGNLKGESVELGESPDTEKGGSVGGGGAELERIQGIIQDRKAKQKIKQDRWHDYRPPPAPLPQPDMSQEESVELGELKDTTLQSYMVKAHDHAIKGQQQSGKTIKRIQGFIKAKQKLKDMGAKTPAVIGGVIQGDRLDPKKLGTGNVYKPDTIKGESVEVHEDHDARELHLHADNDANLHRQRLEPIRKNLRNKMARGTYNSDKAHKAWTYASKDAADSYHKEHGHKFDNDTVHKVAAKMRDSFEGEAKDGDHDHHLYKKYKGHKVGESVEFSVEETERERSKRILNIMTKKSEKYPKQSARAKEMLQRMDNQGKEDLESRIQRRLGKDYK